jgi:phage-related holin
MKFVDSIGAFLAKFISVVFLMLLPIRDAVIAVSLLVIADFITGIWASIKEKKQITSYGFRRTIAKTLAYQGTIVVSFLIEQYMLEGVPVVKVITTLIALTEGKSFFENIHRITGLDFWGIALTKIQGQATKNLPKAKPYKRKKKK